MALRPAAPRLGVAPSAPRIEPPPARAAPSSSRLGAARAGSFGAGGPSTACAGSSSPTPGAAASSFGAAVGSVRHLINHLLILGGPGTAGRAPRGLGVADVDDDGVLHIPGGGLFRLCTDFGCFDYEVPALPRFAAVWPAAPLGTSYARESDFEGERRAAVRGALGRWAR